MKPNIAQMVATWLLQNSYDCLVNHEEGCACERTDLFPCEEPLPTCHPGYRIHCVGMECTNCGAEKSFEDEDNGYCYSSESKYAPKAGCMIPSAVLGEFSRMAQKKPDEFQLIKNTDEQTIRFELDFIDSDLTEEEVGEIINLAHVYGTYEPWHWAVQRAYKETKR